jgi:hypothetical protein
MEGGKCCGKLLKVTRMTRQNGICAGFDMLTVNAAKVMHL